LYEMITTFEHCTVNWLVATEDAFLFSCTWCFLSDKDRLTTWQKNQITI